ncbi:Pxr1, partial [Ophiophagus hannah]
MKEQRASHRANVSLFSNRLLTSSLPRLGGLPLYVGPRSWGKLGCLAGHRMEEKMKGRKKRKEGRKEGRKDRRRKNKRRKEKRKEGRKKEIKDEGRKKEKRKRRTKEKREGGKIKEGKKKGGREEEGRRLPDKFATWIKPAGPDYSAVDDEVCSPTNLESNGA